MGQASVNSYHNKIEYSVVVVEPAHTLSGNVTA